MRGQGGKAAVPRYRARRMSAGAPAQPQGPIPCGVARAQGRDSGRGRGWPGVHGGGGPAIGLPSCPLWSHRPCCCRQVEAILRAVPRKRPELGSSKGERCCSSQLGLVTTRSAVISHTHTRTGPVCSDRKQHDASPLQSDPVCSEARRAQQSGAVAGGGARGRHRPHGRTSAPAREAPKRSPSR